MLTVKIISVIQLYKFYKYIYFAETNHGQKATYRNTSHLKQTLKAARQF